MSEEPGTTQELNLPQMIEEKTQAVKESLDTFVDALGDFIFAMSLYANVVAQGAEITPLPEEPEEPPEEPEEPEEPPVPEFPILNDEGNPPTMSNGIAVIEVQNTHTGAIGNTPLKLVARVFKEMGPIPPDGGEPKPIFYVDPNVPSDERVRLEPREKARVWRQAVEGHGDRFWEMFDHPGYFLPDNYVTRLDK